MFDHLRRLAFVSERQCARHGGSFGSNSPVPAFGPRFRRVCPRGHAVEAFFNAAQMLAALGAPLDPANPYTKSKTEAGFLTFGTPHLLALLGEVSSRALKAVWYEKWYVHRVIRPEEFGGRIHLHLTGQKNYPIDASILDSKAVQEVFARNNTYLLPLQYREGCPQHPSYAQGHGVIAGACVTILKWFFDESFVIPEPVVQATTGRSSYPTAVRTQPR